MVERGHRACFALEALARLRPAEERGVEHFDRDRAIEPGIARFVDLAHAAGADARGHFVGAEAFAFEPSGRGRFAEIQHRGRVEKAVRAFVGRQHVLDLLAQCVV